MSHQPADECAAWPVVVEHAPRAKRSPQLAIALHRGPLSPALLSAIAAIEAQTLQHEAALWGSTGLSQTLAAAHAAVAILRVGEEVTAYCLFTCIAQECEILQIATMPQHQRRGIGRSLLQSVLSYAADQGCDRAVLEVRRGNLAARQMYEQIGFFLDGVRRGYYQHGRTPTSADQDALLLSCPLPCAQPRQSAAIVEDIS